MGHPEMVRPTSVSDINSRSVVAKTRTSFSASLDGSLKGLQNVAALLPAHEAIRASTARRRERPGRVTQQRPCALSEVFPVTVPHVVVLDTESATARPCLADAAWWLPSVTGTPTHESHKRAGEVFLIRKPPRPDTCARSYISLSVTFGSGLR